MGVWWTGPFLPWTLLYLKDNIYRNVSSHLAHTTLGKEVSPQVTWSDLDRRVTKRARPSRSAVCAVQRCLTSQLDPSAIQVPSLTRGPNPLSLLTRMFRFGIEWSPHGEEITSDCGCLHLKAPILIQPWQHRRDDRVDSRIFCPFPCFLLVLITYQ